MGIKGSNNDPRGTNKMERKRTRELALQLSFCFEVRPLSCSLVSSAPEGPSDDVRGFDPRSMKSDGNAADFLE